MAAHAVDDQAGSVFEAERLELGDLQWKKRKNGGQVVSVACIPVTF